MNIKKILDINAKNIENSLKDFFDELEASDSLSANAMFGQERLFDSCKFSVCGGGKRLRAYFVGESCRIFGIDDANATVLAVSAELVHAYSLVHDDLPAMDDALERRGRPVCHIQFDEATAILTGNALLTHAFGLISGTKLKIDPDKKCALLAGLATAIGAAGMLGGQMADIMISRSTNGLSWPENRENRSTEVATEATLEMSKSKTGELFAFCASVGAIATGSMAEVSHLKRFGYAFGLAFQVIDDIADAKVDGMRSAPNLANLLGLDATLRMLESIRDEAESALRNLRDSGNLMATFNAICNVE